jgi:hypothetical protein
MSSFAAVSRVEPIERAFNLAVPALPNATFVYADEESDASVSWSPHTDLAVGIRNRLVDAVGRLPRKWLLPLQDGEEFDTY